MYKRDNTKGVTLIKSVAYALATRLKLFCFKISFKVRSICYSDCLCKAKLSDE